MYNTISKSVRDCEEHNYTGEVLLCNYDELSQGLPLQILHAISMRFMIHHSLMIGYIIISQTSLLRTERTEELFYRRRGIRYIRSGDLSKCQDR